MGRFLPETRKRGEDRIQANMRRLLPRSIKPIKRGIQLFLEDAIDALLGRRDELTPPRLKSIRQPLNSELLTMKNSFEASLRNVGSL